MYHFGAIDESQVLFFASAYIFILHIWITAGVGAARLPTFFFPPETVSGNLQIRESVPWFQLKVFYHRLFTLR